MSLRSLPGGQSGSALSASSPLWVETDVPAPPVCPAHGPALDFRESSRGWVCCRGFSQKSFPALAGAFRPLRPPPLPLPSSTHRLDRAQSDRPPEHAGSRTAGRAKAPAANALNAKRDKPTPAQAVGEDLDASLVRAGPGRQDDRQIRSTHCEQAAELPSAVAESIGKLSKKMSDPNPNAPPFIPGTSWGGLHQTPDLHPHLHHEEAVATLSRGPPGLVTSAYSRPAPPTEPPPMPPSGAPPLPGVSFGLGQLGPSMGPVPNRGLAPQPVGGRQPCGCQAIGAGAIGAGPIGAGTIGGAIAPPMAPLSDARWCLQTQYRRKSDLRLRQHPSPSLRVMCVTGQPVTETPALQSELRQETALRPRPAHKPTPNRSRNDSKPLQSSAAGVDAWEESGPSTSDDKDSKARKELLHGVFRACDLNGDDWLSEGEFRNIAANFYGFKGDSEKWAEEFKKLCEELSAFTPVPSSGIEDIEAIRNLAGVTLQSGSHATAGSLEILRWGKFDAETRTLTATGFGGFKQPWYTGSWTEPAGDPIWCFLMWLARVGNATYEFRFSEDFQRADIIPRGNLGVFCCCCCPCIPPWFAIPACLTRNFMVQADSSIKGDHWERFQGNCNQTPTFYYDIYAVYDPEGKETRWSQLAREQAPAQVMMTI
ncbi:unnamed protein product [Symbiodinium microadriaticum]|nr:unnamed protein product [Symbiodinium microadriaticum]